MKIAANSRDLILNTSVADSVQGHVSPSIKQVFRTLTAVPFKLVPLKLDGYEFLMVDQFGNHYHKMRAVLFDGELYDVDQYIKPSMMIADGGGFADFEDAQAKKMLKITEPLLERLRQQGALIFARTNLDLLKQRSTSQSPVAIETQDITHQANKLEDALTAGIEAKKKALGESVATEPSTAPDFKPVKAQKAVLELADANIIPFPKGTAWRMPEVGLTPDRAGFTLPS